MDRVAIYCRVSTEAQAPDKDKPKDPNEKISLEEQERHCRTRAAERRWEVAAVEGDRMTGFRSLDTRPGLEAVRKLIASGGANIVLMWKMDRGARGALDMLLLHQELLIPVQRAKSGSHTQRLSRE